MRKLKTILALIAGLAIVAQTSACYYDNEEDLYPGSICDTSAVSYASDVKPIVQNNCAISGCHISGSMAGGFLLENYANLKAKVDDGTFVQRVLIDKNMPPSTVLTACQLNTMQAWVNDGAPNN